MENDAKIQELLTRGVERVYPTAEFLRDKLVHGEKLSIYFGIDPTGPTLHIGHAVNLLKLRAFQDLGHKIIILYGGFTAQIGDPTDKLATRQPLTPKQIKQNTTGYKKSIGKILDLKKANIKFLDNERWSNKLKPVDMLELASRFTVSQILERDMFQERLKQGKEISLLEFLYPVFQAYDAVTMGVDVQLGGNDQTFNMLAGRTLMRKMKNKEKAVISMKLLVDPTGKKMGKTEGNMVSLDEKPEEMFGKIMSWPDGMILPAFELCTTIPLGEIAEIKKGLEGGDNPKNAKVKLAEAVVSLYHGSQKAAAARQAFGSTFSEGNVPEDMPIYKAMAGGLLSDAFLSAKTVSSKTDFRRLVGEGAITNKDTGEKVSDPTAPAIAGIYKIGKHRFLKLVIG
ncbi:MAG: tyrosine--tRNA ligase [bacterium]|nr:tyrosine--tRNA ligase [bacterium]